MVTKVEKSNSLKLSVRAVLREAVESEQSISGHLLEVAKQYRTKAEFGDACIEAEQWIRSSEAGRLMLEEGQPLPKAWQNAKSTIKGAYDYEGHKIPGTTKVFKMASYTSEYNMRKDLAILRNPPAKVTTSDTITIDDESVKIKDADTDDLVSYAAEEFGLDLSGVEDRDTVEKTVQQAVEARNNPQAKGKEKNLPKTLEEKVQRFLRNLHDLVNAEPNKGTAIAEAIVDAGLAEAQRLLNTLLPNAPQKVAESAKGKPAMQAVVSGLPKGKGKGKGQNQPQA